MIRHTVVFRLKRPLDADALERVMAALEEFAADPPHASGPAQVDRGLRLRGEAPSAADAILTVAFPDPEAFRAYIEHPKHVALIDDVLRPACEGWWGVQTAE